MVTQKPLLLKDFLELDSAESSAGFRCAPRHPPDAATIRCFLDAELSGGGGILVRSRSKKAVAKLSAVVSALKLLSFSSPDRRHGACSSNVGFLPRSISVKLKKSFSKSRADEEEMEKRKKLDSIRGRSVTVKDIVRLGSFVERAMECSAPSPAVSCSGDGGDASSSDFVRSSAGSSEYSESTTKDDSPPLNPSPKQRSDGGGVSAAAETTNYGDLPTAKEMDIEGSPCSRCWSVTEEKEQLSPVSVMDFPDHDDDEEEEDEPTSDIYFQENIANIQRTTHQLLHKIRRFENLAVLRPVDLSDEFFERDEHGLEQQEKKRARELLDQLEAKSLDEHAETLLLDFFVQGLSGDDDERRLLKAASEWMRDEHARVEDCDGENWIREMERRWRSFADEEEDVGNGVETAVLGSLLEEMVIDLVAV